MFKAVLKTQYKRYAMYRIYFLSDLAGGVVLPVLINILFWYGITETNVIAYDFSNLIQYIIMANLILSLTSVNVEGKLTGHIRSYKLAQQLLLPVVYHRKLLMETVSEKLIRFVFIYLPLVLVLLFVSSRINVFFFILTLPSIFFSFMLNLLFSEIIGELSFWLTETWGISAIKNLVFSVFAGALFPLDLLPADILNVFRCLPFQYMSFVPAKIVFAEVSIPFIFESYFISAVWCLLLFGIERVIWFAGLKKYESCGA